MTPPQPPPGNPGSATPRGSRAALSLIGNTPLLPLHFPAERVTLFAKCEFLNPSGSIKDRLAKCVILDAEERTDRGSYHGQPVCHEQSAARSNGHDASDDSTARIIFKLQRAIAQAMRYQREGSGHQHEPE